jgi:outer membrane protein
VCIGLSTSAANAETLADAVALAYQSNPTLQGARAQVRAVDEEYVQARAGYRPTAEARAQPTLQQGPQQSFFSTVPDKWSNSSTANVEIDQPLFTSGAVGWGVEAASGDIRSARQALRSTESQVLQGVVQAYVDVRRDQRIVAALESEVGILQSQLDDVTARQKSGDVTRTDVEQSLTQLETSRSSLTLAQGQLQVSRSEYFAVVGQNPGELAPEPPLPGLPTTIDEAYAAAQANNPNLIQAEETEKAASARISQAKAQYRPSIALTTTYGYTGPVVPFSSKTQDSVFTVGAQVTVPLFTGGLAQSNVRKAVETDNSDRFSIEATRRQVVQSVSNAWNTALANRASATADERAVETARRYFSDTEEEYRVGQRSTLDVLIAEQALRAAVVAAAQAEHDCYLAQAALLAAVGRLEAADLVADVPVYDPAESFRKVRAKGAVPWEDVIAGFDKIGSPLPERPRPLTAPQIATHPVVRDGPQIPANAGLATSNPTAPLPSTTSPATPPGLGDDRGAPYSPAVSTASSRAEPWEALVEGSDKAAQTPTTMADQVARPVRHDNPQSPADSVLNAALGPATP